MVWSNVIRDGSLEYATALAGEWRYDDERFSAVKKLLAKAAEQFEEDALYALQDRMADHIAEAVRTAAQKAIEAVLNGNEDELRRWISATPGGWTGRDKYPNGEPSTSVIHGKLFETGAVALRKKICEAHPEVLKGERVLDLETQVKDLTNMVNSQACTIERQGKELHDYRRRYTQDSTP